MDRLKRIWILAVTLSGLPLSGSAIAAEWNHPLYLDGGDYWRARIPVVVVNDRDVPLEGEPVRIDLAGDSAAKALVGQPAEAIRVCTEQGVELLFAVYGPSGKSITEGPIPDAGVLVLPADCPARGEAVHYVYFDNPTAGRVPGFLSARAGLFNGDVELGEGDTSDGWKHDAADEQHRASWSTEEPQSGRHCLKTVVAAHAEPTWIATRQGPIHIVGGAKYVIQAWVKGRDVRGQAGWYIHVGDREHSMMMAPMLSAGDGTFGWKRVRLEFTAPDTANIVSLGTVLRGTGTAWFDNVSLECSEPGKVRVAVRPCERMELAEAGAAADRVEWPADLPAHRAEVAVFTFSSTPIRDSLVSLDLAMLAARMRGKLDRGSLRVIRGGRAIRHTSLGGSLLFEASVAPRSVDRCHVYFRDDPSKKSAGAPAGVSLPAGAGNLVANPSFEQGDELPKGWSPTGPPKGADGITFGFDRLGRPELGKRCARMHVPPGLPEAWRGWRQDVAVRPGRTYLLAAWLKCADVRQGEVRVHAHRRTAEGGLSKHQAMTSIGSSISDTTDWTLFSGLFTMPEDTVTFQLHLTTNTSGTVWHDGLLLAEVVPGRITRLEGRPVAENDELAVWPVPAVVKVFRDDPVPPVVRPASISAAGNEKETLQLAVRGGRAVKNVRVEVEPPVGPGGTKLDQVEVNVVGFVPIDHPTNYYRSDGPPWQRMIPNHAGRCDGWPGRWPDPLLPTDTFDLEPNATQPVWITFEIPKDAPAGDYRGNVRFTAEGKTLKTIPYSLHVWDFTLPDENHLAAIYDVRLGPGSRLWGRSLDELYPDIVRFMAERRLCPDTIRPAPSIRFEDGRAIADFTEFDKAATFYFDELNLPFAYTPWTFYLFGWGHPPKTLFGERPYPGGPPYEAADRSRLRPEYKAAYQACLKAFWDHVKQKGWHKRIVLYISDEPYDRHEHIRKQMRALCDMIHEVDPEIPIYSSTWKHVPDWDGSLDVWGIGHYGRVPVEKMAELRRAGDRLWFTTDGQMCTDTPYCAVERLLPHYCFQYGVEAYEFWGVGWLTYDPYQYGWHSYIRQSGEPGEQHWVRYPNGDGFLLYPGGPIGHDGLVSSIRLEQAREGVEDYEYLHMLRQRLAVAKTAAGSVPAARHALEVAGRLVTIPNAGGRYSSRILPDPEALYQARRLVAEAIEQLSNAAGSSGTLGRRSSP